MYVEMDPCAESLITLNLYPILISLEMLEEFAK